MLVLPLSLVYSSYIYSVITVICSGMSRTAISSPSIYLPGVGATVILFFYVTSTAVRSIIIPVATNPINWLVLLWSFTILHVTFNFVVNTSISLTAIVIVVFFSGFCCRGSSSGAYRCIDVFFVAPLQSQFLRGGSCHCHP